MSAHEDAVAKVFHHDSAIPVKLLEPEAQVPTRGSDGAAAYDLYALEDGSLDRNGVTRVRTGIAMAIPEGCVGLIRERSSQAVRGITAIAGVIDQDYRGEIIVVLFNHNGRSEPVEAGDRIAQMLILSVLQNPMEAMEDLDSTTRGGGGFGSTGS
jgi:dUTP pyrophosphatase